MKHRTQNRSSRALRPWPASRRRRRRRPPAGNHPSRLVGLTPPLRRRSAGPSPQGRALPSARVRRAPLLAGATPEGLITSPVVASPPLAKPGRAGAPPSGDRHRDARAGPNRLIYEDGCRPGASAAALSKRLGQGYGRRGCGRRGCGRRRGFSAQGRQTKGAKGRLEHSAAAARNEGPSRRGRANRHPG